MHRLFLALALLAPLTTGCSSDAAPSPEPSLRQAGSFVAVGLVGHQGDLALLRTLKALRLDSDTLLYTTLYDVNASTFEEAREIAKQTTIPILQALLVQSENVITAEPHQVVWFRTLTKAEEDLAP